MTLNPRCHLSPVVVTYDDGVLSMTCGYCQTLVKQILVASEPGAVHGRESVQPVLSKSRLNDSAT